MMTGIDSMTSAPKSSPEPGVSTGKVKPCLGVLQNADGLPERFECLVSGFGERSALQGETQRDWQLEQLGEAHLFLDQCVSTRLITGDVCDQPSERSPR